MLHSSVSGFDGKWQIFKLHAQGAGPNHAGIVSA